MKEHSKREFTVYEADEDAEYDETYVIDLSRLKPTVSFPHLPSNTRTIDQVGEVKIDQAVSAPVPMDGLMISGRQLRS